MRLLDLFCGAGGAGEGYRLAGFEVTGVDIKPQPRYKPGRFIQGDALEYAPAHGHEYDVIHASPPCQAYSVTKHLSNGTHPELVNETRELLQRIGKPYVIENVPGAPLINPLVLCGTMFDGLRVYRHRLFECSSPLYFPPACCHHWGGRVPRAGRGANGKGFMSVSGHLSATDKARQAMGINWMTGAELSQAIPPAYTEWIGNQLMKLSQVKL